MTTTHKRTNPHMFLQRLNSSVSSLSTIPQGEQVVNFELDSFQESDSEHLSKGSPHDELDVERQLSVWDHGSYSKKWIVWIKWFAVLLIGTLGTISVTNFFFQGIYLGTAIDDTTDLINKRGFTIDAFLNGTFVSREDTFKFIAPPAIDYIPKEKDSGLYLTMEKNSQKDDIIVAKRLNDKDFRKPISPLQFTFNEYKYLLESISIDYSLDYAILGSNVIKEYRHSSSGLYWLYNLKTSVLTPVKGKDSKSPHPRLSYCHFSPSYKYIYFVEDNDLHVQSLDDQGDIYRITSDGSNYVLNGRTDWVYEEELLADDVAVWWAPDDSKLAFSRIDDTKVNNYNYQTFINGKQTPTLRSMKYPLPGASNPVISLFLYDLTDNSLKAIKETTEEEGILLYYAKWVNNNNLLFKVSDRESKILDTMIFNSEKNQTKRLLTRDANTYNGWIEKCKEIIVVRRKGQDIDTGFLDILPDKNGYHHIFHFVSPEDTNPKQITEGSWEVKEILGVEGESEIVYFQSNLFHPMGLQLHIASLNDDSATLNLQQTEALEYSKFTLSTSCKFAIKQYLGPDVPYTYAGDLRQLLNASEDDHSQILLTKNEHIEEAIQMYDYPVTEYKEITLEDYTKINYVEIKPKTFEPEKKYPLLVYVYGGPGSETFNTKFSSALEESISSSINAIVLKIEPRGTGGKGWNFKSWANRNIGFWEPRDIINVTKMYIETRKDVIAQDKVAIWGWSYGGFTTLKTLEFDKGSIFKYGVSVAPVTDWKYYDSVYSERYLGSPHSSDAYDKSAKIKDYDSFKFTKRFLLMHGTADDNVHIQNTYELIDNFNLHSVRNYDMHIFPDSDHSIYFHNAQRMVYEKIYFWIKDAFLGKLDSLE
ncbi:Ste13 [Kluyveromyces lactis]|nr:Ste13 [Kluyveromyces lactis]